MTVKTIYADFTETGRTDIYIVLNRPADAYLLANVDGTFEAAPASYPLLTEHAAQKQTYVLTITGPLGNGAHPFRVYVPVGATQDPDNDDPVAGDILSIENDVEVAPDSIMTRLGTPAGASVSADVAAVKDITISLGDLVATIYNRIGAFTGTGVNTILGFFKALLNKDAATPSDIGGTFDPSTDSTEAIADRLSAVGGLTGIHTVTIQFYRTATTTPIPDVAADVYDSTETSRLNGIQLKSDVDGQASFGRDNGTYKVRAMLAGFTFTTGTVVVNDDDVTIIIYGEAVGADAPAPVGAMRVYDLFFMPDGVTPMAAAPVAPAKIINLPYDYNGRLHSGQSLDVTYNAVTGKGYWDLAPGATVEFDLRNFRDRVIQKTLPLTDPDNEIRLEDIV